MFKPLAAPPPPKFEKVIGNACKTLDKLKRIGLDTTKADSKQKEWRLKKLPVVRWPVGTTFTSSTYGFLLYFLFIWP